ncbi:MAG TPA: hypothetical protein VF456_09965 [Vicinamibacterales bacterium]
MTRSLVRLMMTAATVLALWTPMRQSGPLWERAEAAALADAGGNWILLGLVADASGGPSQWRDEPGFVFPGGSAKPDRVVKVGDRVQLTVPKSIRTTNAQGQRPFERDVTNFDTTGEYKVGTVLQVLEIGRKPMSKAGDGWQCWVRVAEGGSAKNH